MTKPTGKPRRANKGTAVTLFPAQRELIQRYSGSLGLADGNWNLFNAHYREFRDMVQSLPPCSEFTEDEVLSIAVSALAKFSRTPEEVAGDPDPAPKAAEYLIHFLQSLPRTYRVQIKLASMPFWGEFSLDLAEYVRLGSVGPGAQEPPNNRLLRALMQQPEPQPEKGLWLEIETSGFANAALETQGTAEAVAVAKQVSFLLVLARMAKRAGWRGVRAQARLLDLSDGGEERLNLPERLALELGGLEPDQEQLQVWEPGSKVLLLGTSRTAVSDEEKLSAFRELADVIQRFYQRSRLPGFARVSAAIEWYQDSLLNDDQTMAFLAACIGLESIFGEEDKGISELSYRLMDRYAFMLGKDRTERKRLAGDFAEVLRVRGELVHARATRLRAKDRQHLRKVREMLLAAIRHEIKPFISREEVRG